MKYLDYEELRRLSDSGWLLDEHHTGYGGNWLAITAYRLRGTGLWVVPNPLDPPSPEQVRKIKYDQQECETLTVPQAAFEALLLASS